MKEEIENIEEKTIDNLSFAKDVLPRLRKRETEDRRKTPALKAEKTPTNENSMEGRRRVLVSTVGSLLSSPVLSRLLQLKDN